MKRGCGWGDQPRKAETIAIMPTSPMAAIKILARSGIRSAFAYATSKSPKGFASATFSGGSTATPLVLQPVYGCGQPTIVMGVYRQGKSGTLYG